MDITEAFARLRAVDAEFEEHPVGLAGLEVEPVGGTVLVADGRRFEVGNGGIRRLCRFFKAPGEYVATLPPGLRASLVRHHLDRCRSPGGEVGLVVRGSEVVGLTRADLVRLAAAEVLEATLDGLRHAEGEPDVVDLEVAGESIRFDLIARGAAREVAPGDVLEAGVRVRHDLIGESATLVEGYVLRLVCRNGMTHRECLGPRRTPRARRLPATHPRARALQLEQVRRLAADAFGRLPERVGGLGRLREERVDFDRLTEGWLRRARLSPDRLVPVLRRAWEEEGAEPTAYGAMNAFTRVATHEVGLPARTRDVLTRLGGLLAFRHEHLCPRCWSLINAGGG